MLPLILGIGLLLLITSEARDKTAPSAADEIFVWVRGTLRYQPPVRKRIIDSFIYRQIGLTPQPDLAMLITPPVTGQVFSTVESGAWGWGNGMHAQGFDLWVRPVLHLPIGPEEPIVFLQPGAPAPQGMAMLIGADTPWPAAPAGAPL